MSAIPSSKSPGSAAPSVNSPLAVPDRSALLSTHKFRTFAIAGLVLNLFTILWGAYVRVSGSGAGCGSHWPLCNGQVIPLLPQLHTLIEFAHRLSSGACLLFAIALFAWGRALFPKGHMARQAALATLVLTVSEALIGAGLVLFELVAHDRSAARAFSISLHLINTLLLLGSIALAVHGAALDTRRPAPTLWPLRAPRQLTPWLLTAFFASILLGVTGALTALGDTLFKSSSLAGGMAQDFAVGSHFLLKLRVAHPIFAVGTAALLYFLAEKCEQVLPDSREVRVWARRLQLIVFIQVAAGALNLVLLAPAGMQLLHLLLADGVWLTLVMLGNASLDSSEAKTAL
jgi:heme a synthase